MKIAIVGNDDFSIWHFRKGLIKALIGRKVEVIVISPDGPYVQYLESLGVRHIATPIYRFLSPLRDLKLCLNLYRIFRREIPDIVHTITAKPNIYGAIAAKLARVPRTVSLISGLGYGFQKDGYSGRLLSSIMSLMYWCSCNLSEKSWFQNQDDLELFIKKRMISRKKAVLIPGSGVNLQEYSRAKVNNLQTGRIKDELGIPANTPVVLMMVARLSWSKGVKEFVEAEKLLSAAGNPAHFLLVGPLDPDCPDSVPETFLRNNEKAQTQFTWLGFRNDVREIIAMADIVTLPSYYREGVPRVLLEAMAMQKPIVTTHNVGCKEVVDEGINGLLVPIKDPNSFAQAIRKILYDRARSVTMGKASRHKVEREFDEKRVISRVFDELYQLPLVEMTNQAA
jgi:N,N'-diacetylbacillosaminyl-diphospho-undecaprenol alpha-1,3-N-acetylgalactosaminyltransferase